MAEEEKIYNILSKIFKETDKIVIQNYIDLFKAWIQAFINCTNILEQIFKLIEKQL